MESSMNKNPQGIYQELNLVLTEEGSHDLGFGVRTYGEWDYWKVCVCVTLKYTKAYFKKTLYETFAVVLRLW